MKTTTQLLLTLTLDSEPIAGSIGPEGRPPTDFCGYTSLIEALERLRTDQAEPGPLAERGMTDHATST